MAADELDDLRLAAAGNLDALHRVMPIVYERVRKIAHLHLTGDRADRWVRASSLVNRAYLKLVEQRTLDFADEARVTAALATIMRRIVVDVARRETAAKRGGDMSRVGLHAEDVAGRADAVDAVELEDALLALGAVSSECARVAELRLWGGMELEQIATALDMPFSRVRSRWNRAKAWLARELGSDAPKAPDEELSDGGA